jgi:hypothetical protein
MGYQGIGGGRCSDWSLMCFEQGPPSPLAPVQLMDSSVEADSFYCGSSYHEPEPCSSPLCILKPMVCPYQRLGNEHLYLNMGIGIEFETSVGSPKPYPALPVSAALDSLGDQQNRDTSKINPYSSRLASLGWRARNPLADGLATTLTLFCDQLNQQLVRLITIRFI